MDAPVFGASVLLDDQLGRPDIDLLNDVGEISVAMQLATAAGAGLERVFLPIGDLFGEERCAFVFGMTGLATNLAFLLPRRRRGRRGLDDVRGRRLGRSRGILTRRGELFLQTRDGRLQVLDLLLQALAMGTGIRCSCFHAVNLR